MRIIKAIVVLALLIAIIGAAYYFIAKPRADVSSHSVSLMDNTESERLDNLLNRFSNYWNDTAYAIAKAYMSHPSRVSDIRQLQDHFYTGLFVKIDSMIVKQCRENAVETRVSNHPILSGAYRGLDSLTNDYAAVNSVSRHNALIDLKTLYDDIYVFSRNTFVLRPQLGIEISGTGANTAVQYTWGRYKDYETYRSVCNTQRQSLESRLRSSAELGNVQWMKTAVSEAHFQGLVSGKAEKYRSEQRDYVLQKFTSLQNAANSEGNTALSQRLEQMHSTFPQWMRNDSKIENAYRQLQSQIQTTE